MSRREVRRRRLQFDTLSQRVLPAVIVPVWVGQAHNDDYAGLASGTAPNDYVDAEIDLTKLSMTADQVTHISFSRLGGVFGAFFDKSGGGLADFIPDKDQGDCTVRAHPNSTLCR